MLCYFLNVHFKGQRVKTHIFILQFCNFEVSNPIFLWGHTADFKGITVWVLMTVFHLPALWKINHINYQVYIHINLSIYHSLISLKFCAASFAFVRISNLYHHTSTSFQPTNNLAYLTKPFLEDPPRDPYTFRWHSIVKWHFKHIRNINKENKYVTHCNEGRNFNTLSSTFNTWQSKKWTTPVYTKDGNVFYFFLYINLLQAFYCIFKRLVPGGP